MIISVTQAYQFFNELDDIVFVDCRYDLNDPTRGEKLFVAKHIKGAVYVDLEKHLSGEVKTTGGRHPLPNLNEFTQLLADKGIDESTTVIAYDNNRAFASRFCWMLKYIGHEKVFLLNGDLDEWEDNGYPVNTGIETIQPKQTYGAIKLKQHLIADVQKVRSSINSATVCLIDSRHPDRYSGKHEPIDKKAGHIPSAVNYEWINVIDETGKFKSKDELEEHFSDLKKYDEIIVYCGSGVTAAPNVLSLMYAGYENVRLYIGSFSDWISYPNNEIAKL